MYYQETLALRDLILRFDDPKPAKILITFDADISTPIEVADGTGEVATIPLSQLAAKAGCTQILDVFISHQPELFATIDLVEVARSSLSATLLLLDRLPSQRRQISNQLLLTIAHGLQNHTYPNFSPALFGGTSNYNTLIQNLMATSKSLENRYTDFLEALQLSQSMAEYIKTLNGLVTNTRPQPMLDTSLLVQISSYDLYGNTPLHYLAISDDYLEIISLILSYELEAALVYKNANGLSPLEVAAYYGSSESALLLAQKMDDSSLAQDTVIACLKSAWRLAKGGGNTILSNRLAQLLPETERPTIPTSTESTPIHSEAQEPTELTAQAQSEETVTTAPALSQGTESAGAFQLALYNLLPTLAGVGPGQDAFSAHLNHASSTTSFHSEAAGRASVDAEPTLARSLAVAGQAAENEHRRRR
jgi:hypothetical protein